MDEDQILADIEFGRSNDTTDYRDSEEDEA